MVGVTPTRMSRNDTFGQHAQNPPLYSEVKGENPHRNFQATYIGLWTIAEGLVMALQYLTVLTFMIGNSA